MTLDFTQTADDLTLLAALRPILTDRIWHDGKRWWARDPRTGTWTRTTMTQGLHWHLAYAATQLPDDPYWDRSRHRLRTFSNMYAIAVNLRWDCFLSNWPQPSDLHLPT